MHNVLSSTKKNLELKFISLLWFILLISLVIIDQKILLVEFFW